MTECHARKCHEPAELRLFVGNDYSFKDRWAGGLDYCQPHAEKVGLSMADRGLRVRIEELGRATDEA